MHDSVMAWVGAQVAALDLADVAALEVGSYNVNGTVRELFTGAYFGIDRVAGPGVDQVMDCEQLTIPDGVWPCVVSTEMLEHADRPWVCIAEMARVLALRGVLLLTARGFDQRGAHGYHNPPDQWRFYGSAMKTMVEDAGLLVRELLADPQVPGWFVHAVKL